MLNSGAGASVTLTFSSTFISSGSGVEVLIFSRLLRLSSLVTLGISMVFSGSKVNVPVFFFFLSDAIFTYILSVFFYDLKHK
ncbi:MAG: hypothetical protein A2583_16320 [Bdellovibrionales bacterium RIFOXYD1_FULL_53_11]|nr:MAG: hypothetical protein A2583_16320 [Bdellovibrionales bacterium RIFOXYD1_FULL_53_11]